MTRCIGVEHPNRRMHFVCRVPRSSQLRHPDERHPHGLPFGAEVVHPAVVVVVVQSQHCGMFQ